MSNGRFKEELRSYFQNLNRVFQGGKDKKAQNPLHSFIVRNLLKTPSSSREEQLIDIYCKEGDAAAARNKFIKNELFFIRDTIHKLLEKEPEELHRFIQRHFIKTATENFFLRIHPYPRTDELKELEEQATIEAFFRYLLNLARGRYFDILLEANHDFDSSIKRYEKNPSEKTFSPLVSLIVKHFTDPRPSDDQLKSYLKTWLNWRKDHPGEGYFPDYICPNTAYSDALSQNENQNTLTPLTGIHSPTQTEHSPVLSHSHQLESKPSLLSLELEEKSEPPIFNTTIKRIPMPTHQNVLTKNPLRWINAIVSGLTEGVFHFLNRTIGHSVPAKIIKALFAIPLFPVMTVTSGLMSGLNLLIKKMMTCCKQTKVEKISYQPARESLRPSISHTAPAVTTPSTNAQMHLHLGAKKTSSQASDLPASAQASSPKNETTGTFKILFTAPDQAAVEWTPRMGNRR